MLLNKTLHATLERVPRGTALDTSARYRLYSIAPWESPPERMQQQFDTEPASRQQLLNDFAVIAFKMPPGPVGDGHYEFVYDDENRILTVYLLDDSHDRLRNAPYHPALIKGAVIIDSGLALVAERMRNDVWRGYMQQLGPGRYDTEDHRRAARAVADAVVDLYFHSEPQVVAATGLSDMQVVLLADPSGQTANHSAQVDAAIKAIATRVEADRFCTPERAVELVRAAEGTERVTPDGTTGG